MILRSTCSFCCLRVLCIQYEGFTKRAMEEGLASLARSLAGGAPGLARVAELRSEMRALRGAIELQLNEPVSYTHLTLPTERIV